MKKKGPNPMIFVGVGFELLALGSAAVYLGPYIDTYFGGRGQGTGILMFILLAGWLVHFIHLAKKFTEAEDQAEVENKKNEGNP